MAKKPYSEKLKDPRWQKKRLEIFERDEWTCQGCGAKDKTLCVHHKTYKNGIEPWECHENLLLTLCEDCHESEHYWYPRVVEKLGVALSACGLMARGVEALAEELLKHCEKSLADRDKIFKAMFSAVGADIDTTNEEGKE